MHLKKVSLFNFKNYEEAEVIFSKKVNCFVGENGSGKTNLLDAIYYLALTKSAWNTTDSQNIKHGTPFFSIKGDFEKEGKVLEVLCSLQTRQKKNFLVNKTAYEKLSEHIGRIPLVLIAPDDTDIIKEGSEARRKFFDGIIAQISNSYLNDLMTYSHFLKQRNSLLKQFSETKSFDADLLEPYNERLITIGEKIHNARKGFIEQFIPLFKKQYAELVEANEDVLITYKSDFLEDGFSERFVNNVQKDLILQRTSMGVHKDDYVFNISDKGIKKFGSQGQQKSFIIALKLTQFDLIKEEKDIMPLLLLDDIFDKLDTRRVAKLMEMVASNKFGQIFITDTNPERTKKMFEKAGTELMVFNVQQGQVSPVS